jgi:hypothetical protein
MFSRIGRVSVSVVVALLSMAIAVAAHAAGPLEQAVTVAPHWKPGEKRHYEIVKIKANPYQGETKRTRLRSKLEIEILKSTPEATQIRWTTSESTVEGLKDKPDPREKEVMALLMDMSLILEISAEGSISDVLNWREAYERIQRGLAFAMGEAKKVVGNNQDLTKIFDKTMATFGTEEILKSRCLLDSRLFFSVLGKTYSISEPLEYEALAPLPFAEASIPSRTVYRLKSFDPQSREAVIRWNLILDPQGLERATQKIVESMTAELGTRAPERISSKGFSMEVVGEASVDTRSGWVNRLQFKKVMEDNGTRKGELLTITRITE